MDLIDTTGSGDVDTSVVLSTSVLEGRTIFGLTGRTLTIPEDWVNPSGKWHVGIKAAFDLFPDVVKLRLQVRVCVVLCIDARIVFMLTACMHVYQ